MGEQSQSHDTNDKTVTKPILDWMKKIN